MNLSDMKRGERAKILAFAKGVDKVHRHRLLAMGLTQGALVSFIRKAPLGDPIEIELRGFHLALRKQEAALIEVEVIS